jgi:hypothetical protein
MTALVLFLSYVCSFGQTDSRANLVNSKHEEFSKYMNQLENLPNKENRKKQLKNISDIVDNNTVAAQHLVEKSVAKRFPVQFQHKKVLIFFKGKAKKSIQYPATLGAIDTVMYTYNVVGSAMKDTIAKSNDKFAFYETKGEAKVNAVQLKKNSKSTYSSETKNILTMVWRVDLKNNKARIDTIYAEPIEFFDSEILAMQEKSKALIGKYYRKLLERESIPELKVSTVQNEFSSDYKPVPFFSMFEGNPYIRISDLTITPSGLTTYEDEPIMIVDVARKAFFNEEQTIGNKLDLRFAIAFDRNLRNERIVKIEWMYGEKFEPEVMFGAKNLKEAQQFGELFLQRLKKFINIGGKDKALEAEILGMFKNTDAVFEVSSLRTDKINRHSIKEYLARVPKGDIETIADRPVTFSNSNVIEMKFKQTFRTGKYCDKTEKKIEMIYEEGKYLITGVTVLETKDCNPPAQVQE